MRKLFGILIWSALSLAWGQGTRVAREADVAYLEASLAFEKGNLDECRRLIEARPKSLWNNSGLLWKIAAPVDAYVPHPEGVLVITRLNRGKALKLSEAGVEKIEDGPNASQSWGETYSVLQLIDGKTGGAKWQKLVRPGLRAYIHPTGQSFYLVGETVTVLNADDAQLVSQVAIDEDSIRKSPGILLAGGALMQVGGANGKLEIGEHEILDGQRGTARKIQYPAELIGADPTLKFQQPRFLVHPEIKGAFGVSGEGEFLDNLLFAPMMRDILVPRAMGELIMMDEHLIVLGAESGREGRYSELNLSNYEEKKDSPYKGEFLTGLLQESERGRGAHRQTGHWKSLSLWEEMTLGYYDQSAQFRLLDLESKKESAGIGQPWWIGEGFSPNRQVHRVGDSFILSGAGGIRAYHVGLLSGDKPSEFFLAALYDECRRKQGSRKFGRRAWRLIETFPFRPEGWEMLYRDGRRRRSDESMQIALVGLIRAWDTIGQDATTAYSLTTRQEAADALVELGLKISGYTQQEVTQAARGVEGRHFLSTTGNRVYEISEQSFESFAAIDSVHHTWSRPFMDELAKVMGKTENADPAKWSKEDIESDEAWRKGARPQGGVYWRGDKAYRALAKGGVRLWNGKDFETKTPENPDDFGRGWRIWIGATEALGFDQRKVWLLDENMLPTKMIYDGGEDASIMAAICRDNRLALLFQTVDESLQIIDRKSKKVLRKASIDDDLTAVWQNSDRFQLTPSGVIISADHISVVPENPEKKVRRYSSAFQGRAPVRDKRGSFFTPALIISETAIVAGQNGTVFQILLK